MRGTRRDWLLTGENSQKRRVRCDACAGRYGIAVSDLIPILIGPVHRANEKTSPTAGFLPFSTRSV
jgi:hypothetical protein